MLKSIFPHWQAQTLWLKQGNRKKHKPDIVKQGDNNFKATISLSVFSTTAKGGLGQDAVNRSCALLRLWPRLYKPPFTLAPITPSETPQHASETKSIGGMAQQCTCPSTDTFQNSVILCSLLLRRQEFMQTDAVIQHKANIGTSSENLFMFIYYELYWNIFQWLLLAPGSRAGVRWVGCWACTLCCQRFTLAQPSISSVSQLLAELLLKEHRMGMSQVLTRSHETLSGTALVSQVSTMPGCAPNMGWCSALFPGLFLFIVYVQL